MLKPRCRKPAFTLVELLTVIFIISLLIAILVPALGAARNAAKKASSQSALRAIDSGMEMFKNEQGKLFPQTNGYPPSFAHPPILEANFRIDEAVEGRFPFISGMPVVYGAHWLPAMLIGMDARGYIARKAVPQSLRNSPHQWYEPPDGTEPIARAPLYVDPEGVKLMRTENIPGRRPEATTLFSDWEAMAKLPVITDSFDQPILYYAANANGRATNMVGTKREKDNQYGGNAASQSQGPPFYFHQDNEGFTGVGSKLDDSFTNGWDFGNSGGSHPLGVPGDELTASDFADDITPEERDTFARYILDRKLYQSIKKPVETQGWTAPTPSSPLKPVNSDTYLLISPGVDGVYGTNDDISNVPAWQD